MPEGIDTLRETSWQQTYEFLTNRKLRNFLSHRQEKK